MKTIYVSNPTPFGEEKNNTRILFNIHTRYHIIISWSCKILLAPFLPAFSDAVFAMQTFNFTKFNQWLFD